MTLANLITLIIIFAFFRMIAKLLARQAEEEKTPERFREGRFRAPEEKIKDYLTSLGIEVEPGPEPKEIKVPPRPAKVRKEKLSVPPPPRVQRAQKKEEEPPSAPLPRRLVTPLTKDTLKQGIILSEILGPPRSRRRFR